MQPMPPRAPFLRLPCRTPTPEPHLSSHRHRRFTVLAIETSCDDTSVAILHTPTLDTLTTATLLFHKTITSPNRATGGIHPLHSLTSHRRHLAPLIQLSLASLPAGTSSPDLVAVTRGPGMIASLAVGLDTAKGLAAAWRRPLVGVNHMHAHALTPRLIAALSSTADGPRFPFLTLLVSGGHTLLVHSRTLTSHTVLAGSIDIAVGDMVDKAARALLPAAVLRAQGDAVAYGQLLEEYCFPTAEYHYHPPGTAQRKLETLAKVARFGDWKLPAPLAKSPQQATAAFSFSGLGSAVQRYLDVRSGEGVDGGMEDDERRALGREAMMLAFEHVAGRVVRALRQQQQGVAVREVVASGGVASNAFLRHLLRACLDQAGFEDVRLVVPPMCFCTDNAAMVAWAGLEMWREGWETGMEVMPIRKWSLDDDVPSEEIDERGVVGTGGILGARGWIERWATAKA